MSVSEAVWEAYLAKVDESGADILEEAASGIPIRRLLKTHRDRIAAVVRPRSVRPDARELSVGLHFEEVNMRFSRARSRRGSPAPGAPLLAVDFPALTPDPDAFKAQAREVPRQAAAQLRRDPAFGAAAPDVQRHRVRLPPGLRLLLPDRHRGARHDRGAPRESRRTASGTSSSCGATTRGARPSRARGPARTARWRCTARMPHSPRVSS